MSKRLEIVVLAILLALVGTIIVGFFVLLGASAIPVTHSSSGGTVYVGTSCPPPPAASAGSCNGD